MTFTLLFPLFFASSARAQDNPGNWTVTVTGGDGNDHPAYHAPDGYALYGTQTGTGHYSSYPKDMITYGLTDAGVTASPRYPNGVWLNWMSPNPLDAAYQGISTYANEIVGRAFCGNFIPAGPNIYTYFRGSDGQGPYEDITGGLSTTTTGTLSAKFVWQGAAGVPIPDHVDILLVTNTNAAANTSYLDGVTDSVTASATTTVPQFNETASVTASGKSSGEASGIGTSHILGRHLIRAKVNGGTATVQLTGTVQAQTRTPISYGGHIPEPLNGAMQASAGGEILAYANWSNREVIVTCPTIETSYRKGTPPVENKRYSDTKAINTDSVVISDGGRWKVAAGNLGYGFGASAANFQHPYYTWSLQGSGTPNAYTSQYLNVESDQYNAIPVNLDFGSGNTGFPKTSTIRVDVRDSDNATAANTFTVRWHQPYENWSNYANGNNFWQPADPVTVDSGGFASHNGSLKGTWSYTDTTISDVANIFINVGGNIVPNPIYAGFITVAGIAYNQTQPQNTTEQSVNFNDAWSSSHSTFDPPPADNTEYTQTGYKMTDPTMWVEYQPKFYHGDAYDSHGYTGQASKQDVKYTGHTDLAGHFVSGGSVPPPGG